MGAKTTATLWIALVLAAACCTSAQESAAAFSNTSESQLELARHENQSSTVRLETARMDEKAGIAVIFEGTDDLHYYAKSDTAPAPGFELKVKAESDNFGFGQAIFPKWHLFTDSLGSKVEVYAGQFVVFVPLIAAKAPTKTTVIETGDADITISGIACTSTVCLQPFEKTLRITIDLSRADSWNEFSFQTSTDTVRKVTPEPRYSIWLALTLAFLAGLILNIMPCVWPVLPLIVMRIVGQAKQTESKSASMGFAFCLGILLFFACLAGANIILQVFYGTVLQWGDQFRSPVFRGGMSLLLVVLALLMFGVFTISIPSSITSKSGSAARYSGPVGMGFLAAVLSTPCGFGILAASFGWAQTQHWLLATFAIMVIGVGMAAPYALLISMPGLLNRLPKAGRWMELFKQGIGFVLLAIAVKLLSALPQTRKSDVLYFAVVLAFCVWMWGRWIDYSTKPLRRWLIKIAAVSLAIAAAGVFLSPQADELIDWQEYDTAVIENALAEKRPVLIKFTADWCLSCQVAEKVVYSRKDIAKLIELKNVLAIKADTTEQNLPATIALKDIYNEPGVPVSLLFVPGSKEPVRWHGILFADELEKSLQELTNNIQDSES